MIHFTNGAFLDPESTQIRACLWVGNEDDRTRPGYDPGNPWSQLGPKRGIGALDSRVPIPVWASR